MVDVEINDDGTLTYNVNHLKTFSFDGKEIDALPYLAEHAAALINRIFGMPCTKEDFEEKTFCPES